MEKFIRRTARTQELPHTFFRCRVSDEKLKSCDMGAPPPNDLVTPGRLNPEGISVLYLSDDKDVCIQEVRAAFQDCVNLAQFHIKGKLKLVDLINFEEKAFNRSDEEDDRELLAYYLNRDILNEISKEFAKPSNNSSKIMNYLPLQYISEFIKSKGYQGILYSSVMNEDATNLVLFDQSLATIDESIEFKKITNIGYSHKKIS